MPPLDERREPYASHGAESVWGRVAADAHLELSQLPRRIKDTLYGWRLGFSLDVELVLKIVITAVLMITFTILQTTFFTRFRLFGAIPDLMLPFVLAISALEREKFGAITALIAAFVIDAAGGTSVMLLPLLYVPCAIACALLTKYYFKDAVPTIAMYTIVTSCLRGVVTFAVAMMSIDGMTAGNAMLDCVLPGLAANVVAAAFPQATVRLCMRPFHKTRAERTGRRALERM